MTDKFHHETDVTTYTCRQYVLLTTKTSASLTNSKPVDCITLRPLPMALSSVHKPVIPMFALL